MYVSLFRVISCTRSKSICRPGVNEVDHTEQAYYSVGRTTVVYTVKRCLTGIPDRLSWSSRNSLLPYLSCDFTNVHVLSQSAGRLDDSSKTSNVT